MWLAAFVWLCGTSCSQTRHSGHSAFGILSLGWSFTTFGSVASARGKAFTFYAQKLWDTRSLLLPFYWLASASWAEFVLSMSLSSQIKVSWFTVRPAVAAAAGAAAAAEFDVRSSSACVWHECSSAVDVAVAVQQLILCRCKWKRKWAVLSISTCNTYQIFYVDFF